MILPFSGFNLWGEAYLDTLKIQERFNDIEKALNYMNGNKPLKINLRDELNKAGSNGDTTLHLNFFDVTFYKKGTAHITFKDLDLLKRLNLFAGQKKAWLPPSYGQKDYEDMTEEEKEVINDFEGADSYKLIMTNPNKWLINTQLALSL